MFSVNVDRERVLNIGFKALGIPAYMTILIDAPKNYITQTPTSTSSNSVPTLPLQKLSWFEISSTNTIQLFID